MKRKLEKIKLLIAVYRGDTHESQIAIGEGFTLVEATIRAIEYKLDDEDIRNAIVTYGPDDYEGLYEWYLSRGIVISEPLILTDEIPNS